MAGRKKRRRPPRGTLILRWLGVGAVVLVAFLYWRPLQSYLVTRHVLAARQAEVRALAAEKRALEQQVAASTSLVALAREARRLGLVRPGQHLYIVKGIPGWRHTQATSIATDGGR